MKRVLFLVEGQTEETFVREVLAHHLATFAVHSTPVIVKTKRTKSGHSFKGGVTEYAKIRNDTLRLLNDSDAVAITTLLDYYGLPGDTPGLADRPAGDCYARVEHVERAIDADIAAHRTDPRFKAFLALHEYEGLLFAAPAKIADAFPELSIFQLLEKISLMFASPEEIDEGESSHPSARILAHAPGYQKPVDGVLIALEIGLPQIRAACHHFDAWVTWLESR